MTALRSTTDDRDLTEVNNKIAETIARMRDDDADMMALAQRLQALREVRARTPAPEYVEEVTIATAAEQWATDPRAALLNRFTGVRLTKGKVGRTFAPSRLTFIKATGVTFPPSVLDDRDTFFAVMKARLDTWPSIMSIATPSASIRHPMH